MLHYSTATGQRSVTITCSSALTMYYANVCVCVCVVCVCVCVCVLFCRALSYLLEVLAEPLGPSLLEVNEVNACVLSKYYCRVYLFKCLIVLVT